MFKTNFNKINNKFFTFTIILLIVLLFLYYYLNNNIQENFSEIITVPLKQPTKTSFAIQVFEGSGTLTFESLSLSNNQKDITFTKLKSYNLKQGQRLLTDVLTSGNIGYSITYSGGTYMIYNIYANTTNCMKVKTNVCNSNFRIIKATEFSSINSIFKQINDSVIYGIREFFKINNIPYDNKYNQGIMVTAFDNSKICLRIRDGSLGEFYQQEEQNTPFTYTYS